LGHLSRTLTQFLFAYKLKRGIGCPYTNWRGRVRERKREHIGAFCNSWSY